MSATSSKTPASLLSPASFPPLPSPASRTSGASPPSSAPPPTPSHNTRETPSHKSRSSRRRFVPLHLVDEAAAVGVGENPPPPPHASSAELPADYQAAMRQDFRLITGRLGVGVGPDATREGITFEMAVPGGAVHTVAVLGEQTTCDCAEFEAGAAAGHEVVLCPHVRFVMAQAVAEAMEAGMFRRPNPAPVPPPSWIASVRDWISPRAPVPEPPPWNENVRADAKRVFAAALAVPPGGNEYNTYGGNATRQDTEGDCPICMGDLDAEKKEVVWCRARCGVNLHAQCLLDSAMISWSEGQNRLESKCPYCQSAWIFPGLPPVPKSPARSPTARAIDLGMDEAEKVALKLVRLWYWIEDTRERLNDMVFLAWKWDIKSG